MAVSIYVSCNHRHVNSSHKCVHNMAVLRLKTASSNIRNMHVSTELLNPSEIAFFFSMLGVLVPAEKKAVSDIQYMDFSGSGCPMQWSEVEVLEQGCRCFSFVNFRDALFCKDFEL